MIDPKENEVLSKVHEVLYEKLRSEYKLPSQITED